MNFLGAALAAEGKKEGERTDAGGGRSPAPGAAGTPPAGSSWTDRLRAFGEKTAVFSALAAAAATDKVLGPVDDRGVAVDAVPWLTRAAVEWVKAPPLLLGRLVWYMRHPNASLRSAFGRTVSWERARVCRASAWERGNHGAGPRALRAALAQGVATSLAGCDKNGEFREDVTLIEIPKEILGALTRQRPTAEGDAAARLVKTAWALSRALAEGTFSTKLNPDLFGERSELDLTEARSELIACAERNRLVLCDEYRSSSEGSEASDYARRDITRSVLCARPGRDQVFDLWAPRAQPKPYPRASAAPTRRTRRGKGTRGSALGSRAHRATFDLPSVIGNTMGGVVIPGHEAYLGSLGLNGEGVFDHSGELGYALIVMAGLARRPARERISNFADPKLGLNSRSLVGSGLNRDALVAQLAKHTQAVLDSLSAEERLGLVEAVASTEPWCPRSDGGRPWLRGPEGYLAMTLATKEVQMSPFLAFTTAFRVLGGREQRDLDLARGRPSFVRYIPKPEEVATTFDFWRPEPGVEINVRAAEAFGMTGVPAVLHGGWTAVRSFMCVTGIDLRAPDARARKAHHLESRRERDAASREEEGRLFGPLARRPGVQEDEEHSQRWVAPSLEGMIFNSGSVLRHLLTGQSSADLPPWMTALLNENSGTVRARRGVGSPDERWTRVWALEDPGPSGDESLSVIREDTLATAAEAEVVLSLGPLSVGLISADLEPHPAGEGLALSRRGLLKFLHGMADSVPEEDPRDVFVAAQDFARRLEERHRMLTPGGQPAPGPLTRALLETSPAEATKVLHEMRDAPSEEGPEDEDSDDAPHAPGWLEWLVTGLRRLGRGLWHSFNWAFWAATSRACRQGSAHAQHPDLPL